MPGWEPASWFRPSLVAQHETADLAGRRERHFGDEIDAARHLEARQVPVAPVENLVGRHPALRPTHHERVDILAAHLVREADDRRLLHLRMLVQHQLDLLGKDVAAVADDHVLDAVEDIEIAVLIEAADVAGTQPAVLERRRG